MLSALPSAVKPETTALVTDLNALPEVATPAFTKVNDSCWVEPLMSVPVMSILPGVSALPSFASVTVTNTA